MTIERLAAVIFDMDGLLLDTERVAFESFNAASADLGLDIGPDVYRRCVGTNEAMTRQILTTAIAGRCSYEDLYRLWDKKFDALIEYEVPVKHGAQELLEAVRGLPLRLGLATSTARARAIEQLRRAGLLGFFDHVVAGDEVGAGKPDPEIYLKAATALGVAPVQCLAVEDSDNGVRAAHAAGMRVIQVPDGLKPSSDVIVLGHKIVGSLEDVSRYLKGSIS